TLILLASVLSLLIGSLFLEATTTHADSSCVVTYTVTNQWNTGFGASFTIQNTSASAWTSWSLQFSFPNGQTITQLWNGNFTQNGAAVTVTNLSYNGAVAAGATVTSPPGFNANWSGSNNAPTSFSINGSACDGSAPPTNTPTPTQTNTPTPTNTPTNTPTPTPPPPPGT